MQSHNQPALICYGMKGRFITVITPQNRALRLTRKIQQYALEIKILIFDLKLLFIDTGMQAHDFVYCFKMLRLTFFVSFFVIRSKGEGQAIGCYVKVHRWQHLKQFSESRCWNQWKACTTCRLSAKINNCLCSADQIELAGFRPQVNVRPVRQKSLLFPVYCTL